MALGGVYMIAIEQWRLGRFNTARFHAADREIGDVNAPQALFIGAMQCVAMIPGTSRSMMTITAGILTGLRPRAAAEFSFLLGVPTLGAACLYKLAKNLYYAGKPITNPTDGQGGAGEVHRSLFEVLGVGAVAIGMVAATVSAMIAVRWLVGFLNRHGLTAFGVYRLLLALCLVGLLLGRVVQWP
jgi:undecaprenyl-diphosphatase